MHGFEREIKLEFSSVAEARQAVARLGLAIVRERRLQDDTLLDTPDGRMRGRRCTLRLRADGRDTYLTFKGTPQPDLMKVREERETTVGDREQMLAILQGAGFVPTFRYQKYREEFCTSPELIVALDETPIGVFVELEGDAAAIRAAAGVLGRGDEHFIVASYASLFLARREAWGLAASEHMVFPS